MFLILHKVYFTFWSTLAFTEASSVLTTSCLVFSITSYHDIRNFFNIFQDVQIAQFSLDYITAENENINIVLGQSCEYMICQFHVNLNYF